MYVLCFHVVDDLQLKKKIPAQQQKSIVVSVSYLWPVSV